MNQAKRLLYKMLDYNMVLIVGLFVLAVKVTIKAASMSTKGQAKESVQTRNKGWGMVAHA